MAASKSIGLRIIIVLFFFGIAVAGFMMKLPAVFRHHDKILHSAFYFLAAAFLNILFRNRNLLIHALLFAGLYGFGVLIERAQEYSNTFFHKRIHGRYDPEDIQANLEGLIAFSVVWVILVLISLPFRKKEESTVPTRSDR